MGLVQFVLCLVARLSGGVPFVQAFVECLALMPPSPVPPVPPVPPPVPPTPPNPPDPLRARVKLQHGNAGCTGSVLGPRSDPAKVWVLTAAHCVPGVGGRGRATLTDGRQFDTEVMASDGRADLALLLLEGASPGMPYAEPAMSVPPIGTQVWHAGYGIDVPGDRVNGTVAVPEDPDGQTEFRMTASPGDSGSGIYRNDTGEIVGVVCCVDGFPGTRLWGGSANSIRRLLNAARDRLATLCECKEKVPCETLPQAA